MRVYETIDDLKNDELLELINQGCITSDENYIETFEDVIYAIKENCDTKKEIDGVVNYHFFTNNYEFVVSGTKEGNELNNILYVSEYSDDMSSDDETESKNKGDLVPLIWMIEKLRGKEDGCTMNELISELNINFKGLNNIKHRNIN